MEIGKSGISVSAIGMGTWAIGGGTWWGENDDSRSVEAILCALDGGINWIDTAPVYGFGHSEEVVGRALKGRRNQVVLSTKCGLQWDDGKGTFHFARDGREVYRDLSAAGLRRDLENSLRRLGTDYIDVYYTHWQSTGPSAVPIAETMGELMKMKSEGKIRAVGASNVAVGHLEEYLKYGQLDVIQEKFSMMDRKPEQELLPFCLAHGITVQTYSPLEQGLLTGKIGMDYQVKPGEVRDHRKWWIPGNRRLVLDMLAGWGDLTEKYGCTVGNLVIAWTAARCASFNVLCGARKPEQVAENLKAGGLEIEKADLGRMTRDADAVIAAAE
jgi:methylglyoxal reductase